MEDIDRYISRTTLLDAILLVVAVFLSIFWFGLALCMALFIPVREKDMSLPSRD